MNEYYFPSWSEKTFMKIELGKGGHFCTHHPSKAWKREHRKGEKAVDDPETSSLSPHSALILLPHVPGGKFLRVWGFWWGIFHLDDANWILLLHFLAISVGIGDKESNVNFPSNVFLHDAFCDLHLKLQAVALTPHSLCPFLLQFFSVAHTTLIYCLFPYISKETESI